MTIKNIPRVKRRMEKGEQKEKQRLGIGAGVMKRGKSENEVKM